MCYRRDRLPSIVPMLGNIKIRHAIEQHMMGRGGLFRQNNVEKRRAYSVREWAELCMLTDEFKAPTKEDLVLMDGGRNSRARANRRRRAATEEQGDFNNQLATPPMKDEDQVDTPKDDDMGVSISACIEVFLKLTSVSC